MRTIFLCALALLLVIQTSLAQDAKPDTQLDPNIELMGLYTKKDRNWVHRDIRWERGESPIVQMISTRIASVKDGRAQLTTETQSADGNSYSSSSRGVDTGKPTEEQLGWASAGAPLEDLDMGFRTFKCRKHLVKTEGKQTTTWISTEFHPLLVKQVMISGSSTHIRKLTSFYSADIDPYQLYRKEGRQWTIRTKSGNGAARTETSMRYRVKEVREGSATFTLSILDGKGAAMFSQDTEIQFEVSSMTGGFGGGAEIEMVTKTCAAGEFTCYHTNMAGFESWTSVDWPGLTVASKMKGYEMELTEFDLGHDSHAFFRKQGNFYVTRTTNGDETIQQIRVEVGEVSETEASSTVTVTDAAGKQLSSETQTHTFPGADADPVGYANQTEQLIETTAGTYPALRLKTDAGETWTWQGITIYAKSQVADNEGAEMQMLELIELKME